MPTYDYSILEIDAETYVYGTATMAAHCTECGTGFVSTSKQSEGAMDLIYRKFRRHIRIGEHKEKMERISRPPSPSGRPNLRLIRQS